MKPINKSIGSCKTIREGAFVYKKVLKPCFDFIISLFACIFLCPITAVVGLLIKKEDSGKVFYKAKRLGVNGKVFDMYKFRSMKENAPDIRNDDGTTFSSPDDPRLTVIGKKLRETSIDELPQFINVLKGQMSILGPRPDPPEWYEINSGEMRKKYTVKPGISGYTQAYYRNSLPLEEKNKSDLYYAENVSFLLDVKVFFKTIKTILSHSDVYRNEEVVDFAANENKAESERSE